MSCFCYVLYHCVARCTNAWFEDEFCRVKSNRKKSSSLFCYAAVASGVDKGMGTRSLASSITCALKTTESRWTCDDSVCRVKALWGAGDERLVAMP